MKNKIKAYELLEYAKKCSNDKKFDNALHYLKKCAKYKEFSKDILFEKAKIFYELNELDKSCRYFSKYIKNSSDTVLKANAMLILSKIYKINGRYDKALNLLDSMNADKNPVMAEWEKERLDISYYKINDFFKVHEFSGDPVFLIKEFQIIKSIRPKMQRDLFFIARISNYLHNYQFTKQLINKYADLTYSNDIFYNNAILNEFEIASKEIFLKSKPRGLWIAPGSKCNISCIMCFSKDIKWELSDKNIKDIYSYMPYLENIVWWGGEPTISEKFYEMIKYALSYKHIKHTVITNGQYLPQKFIDLVINNSIEVAFSIDSVDKNKYEKIRVGASFEKLIGNIEKLRPLADKKLLKINSVIADYNSKEINQILRFAKKMNFRTVSFIPMISKDIKDNMLKSADDLNKIDKALRNDSGVEVNSSIKILSGKKNLKNCMTKGFCHTPWSYATIRYDGKIVPDNLCTCYRKESFDLTDSNFLQYWNSEYIMNLRKYIVADTACSVLCPQANILEKIKK
ncbi:MAG: radical SAM protein [Endomicrobiaceae bacterium]